MATITPSVPTGSYFDHQTIKFTFSADISLVAMTEGDIPPSISKYIAYDTLSPPGPFIAVTEDGTGRVVYDGGFPKFYNGNIPDWTNVATRPKTFSALIASHKFLYNALNWVANASKVAAGNKKVLILGDKNPGLSGTGNQGGEDDNYIITNDVRGDGFKATFDTILSAAGYIPTYKLPNQYAGNTIDARLTELEQYCCVILLSSDYRTVPRLTSASINDFSTYRANGNGIILITDHGHDLGSIGDVTNIGGGFFKTANAIASRFGAYFTGNYDRTPVNVGYLRTNYGDHPLYNGMANTDSIVAGDSESKVVVSTTPTYLPPNLPTVTTNKVGLNVYNVLAVLSNGLYLTGRYVYNIQGEEFVFVKTTNFVGVEVINGPKVYASKLGTPSLRIDTDASKLGTIWGEILLNGYRIGEFFNSGDGVTTVYYFASGNISPRVKEGDTVDVNVVSPFTYGKRMVVTRDNLSTLTPVSIASQCTQYRTSLALPNAITRTHSKAYDKLLSGQTAQAKQPTYSLSGIKDKIVAMIQDTAIAGEITTAQFAANAAGVDQLIANAGTAAPVKQFFINLSNNQIYAYSQGAYRAIPGLIAKNALPVPCYVKYGSSRILYDKNGNWTNA